MEDSIVNEIIFFHTSNLRTKLEFVFLMIVSFVTSFDMFHTICTHNQT